MEEWKEYNFTEIATIISGGTPKTSNRVFTTDYYSIFYR